MKRVRMLPGPDRKQPPHGIGRAIEAYAKHLPAHGWEVVPSDASRYDLTAVHAGSSSEPAEISHCHGLYWTEDYEASSWEYRANAKVIESLRKAKEITVPSEWVAETLRRDMHVNPTVVPHGIDWADWQNLDARPGGYVLYNKNRQGDVCDATPVTELAKLNPDRHFLTTFAVDATANVKVTGVLPHRKMKEVIQRSSVYLATTKETFGIGILEALASGVPVLGYAHGGILETVEHGVNGYLAEPGAIDDLNAGLAYCLEHRDRLSDNARESARRWTWQAACEIVAGVYERALQPDPPTVAIIIPCYNYAHLVSGAIRTAIHQTYPHVKDIVVVDDGSTDKTAEVVATWMKRDSRVQYIHQDNSGVAIARNTGVAATDAKYICCLDADDELDPKFVATLVPHLERDRGLGIAYSRLKLITESGKIANGAWPNENDYDKQVAGQNQIPTCNLFRREAWERLGGYRQRYAPLGCGTEDAEFWLRIGSIGYDARLVTKERLFLYRLGGSTTGRGRPYQEVNWLEWHPWIRDKRYPFASMATPKHHSHPVRQYDKPLISVVIPVGPGHEMHVVDALDSLEAQTFRGWEAIVVDDRGCPPDNWLANAYPFVRYVSTYEDNGKSVGAGAARNTGAELVRAPLLLFLDADDWLLPEALELFLDAYATEGEACIVYAASHGRRWLDEAGLEEAKRKDLLIDATGGVATLFQGVTEYNYDVAVKQPFTERPYFWCYITSLLPTAWHFDVGGFDEDLPTWEDWDYWIRLAKQGKPFAIQPEPVMVYNFDSGARRENGRAAKAKIRDMLMEKHREVNVMPCSGCGKRRPRVSVPYQRVSPTSSAQSDTERSETMNDSDYVMITYNPQRGGTHGVIGTAVFPNKIAPNMAHVRGGWVFNYGYRAQGDRFLVHHRDVDLAPSIFIPVKSQQAARTITVPVSERQTPADTRRLQAPPPSQPKPARAEEPEPEPEPETPPLFDPQVLPGVTPGIAEGLIEAGLDTPEKILEAGESLTEISGVGPAKQEMILEAVQGMLEPKEPASEDEVLDEIAKILGEGE